MAIFRILARPYLRRISTARHFSSKPRFGLIFDIDGVIVRGKNVLPPVPDGFKRLIDAKGNFRIPTIFVTNSGNALPSEKASDLSKWLGIKISEEQVIMAHTPLTLLRQYHNKHVLVSGQGRIRDIAKELGFNKIVTIDEVAQNFPSLDYVNKDRRNPQCGPINKDFPTIEGILLLSEPINWEVPLQLMVDILMTNGMPSYLPEHIPYPHIPVLACNMDLLWVSEAPIPRYGHGAFLLCLEELYKKVTGKELIFSALVGKPSEITYYHANQKILNHARSIGINHNINTIYAIGDNINTDIYGANLFDKYLSNCMAKHSENNTLESLLGKEFTRPAAEACISILVETGVHKRDSEFMAHHCPRDLMPVEKGLCKPAFIVKDASHAIDLALKEEKFD